MLGRSGLSVGLAFGLGACSSLPQSVNPAAWWQGLTDKSLSTERPPPPAADAPYPNLATVPPKPPPADAKQHGATFAALVADRTNAQYEASTVPIRDPSSPAASPELFGAAPAGSGGGGSAPAAGAAAAAPAARAKLAAAEAPSSPQGNPQPGPTGSPSVNPAKPAPKAAVQQSPLAPPPAAATSDAGQNGAPGAAAGASGSAQAPAAQNAKVAQSASANDALATSLDMPNAPPPPPQVPGAPVPQVTKPVPPPTAPAKPPEKPKLAADAFAPVAIAFPPGSAVLPASEIDKLKALAARRAGRAIAVVGYGDATSATVATQTAAITLALARARAVMTALEQAGVPEEAISIDAEANGQGAIARLVEDKPPA